MRIGTVGSVVVALVMVAGCDSSTERGRDANYVAVSPQVAAADDARGARGQNAGATMPGVVWFGLITGALVTVGLIFTLQIRRTFRELLLAGLFSALIAFLLFLIWDFDAPFGRAISATTAPFLDLFPHATGG